VVAHDEGQQSQSMSGRVDSSSSVRYDFRPWSGRLRTQTNSANLENVSQKGKEKVDDTHGFPEISEGQSIVDGDSSGSNMSLDEDLGIPSMKTLGVKNAMEGMNAKLRRSSRVKKPVQRLMYDGYVAYHYAYYGKGCRSC